MLTHSGSILIMNISILSAGPSLRQTFNPDQRYDLRIGVNGAASVFCCDWWCAGDGQTFAETTPVGFPVLFTMTKDDGHLRRAGVAGRLLKHRVVEWGPILTRSGAPSCAQNWSVTMAVVLAVDLGARHIDLFGHDMKGTVDCNGKRLEKRNEYFSTKRTTNVPVDMRDVLRWCPVSFRIHQPEVAACM